MSGTRLSRQAEQELDVAVTSLEQQLIELRSSAPQYVGGASVRYYTSQAAGQFDWTGSLNDPGGTGYGGKLFLITAVGQTMNAFYGQVTAYIYQNSSSTLYDGLQWMQDYAAGNAVTSASFTDAPNDTTQPTVKKWFAQVNGDSTKPLWVKFQVLGLDIANVTVTALT